MANFGIKSSSKNLDVFNTKTLDLVFTSAYNMHKIRLSGEKQPQANVQIDHSLGYRTFYLYFSDNSSGTKTRLSQSALGINSQSLKLSSVSTIFQSFYIFYDPSI